MMIPNFSLSKSVSLQNWCRKCFVINFINLFLTDAVYARVEGTLNQFHDRIFKLEELAARNEDNIKKATEGIQVYSFLY